MCIELQVEKGNDHNVRFRFKRLVMKEQQISYDGWLTMK